MYHNDVDCLLYVGVGIREVVPLGDVMGLQDINLQHASWHRYILYALHLTDKPFDPRYAVCTESINKPVSRDEIEGRLAGLPWSCVCRCA